MKNKTSKHIVISLVELTGGEDTAIINEVELKNSPDQGLNYPDRWLEKKISISLFNPEKAWQETKINLDIENPPDTFQHSIQNKEFVCSSIGDIYGKGEISIISAVTLKTGQCYILSFKQCDTEWKSDLITEINNPEVNYIRSIAIADINNDGIDEIVFATKPNGIIYYLVNKDNQFIQTIIEKQRYGVGTTNTRELLIADFNNKNEILAAIAYSYAGSNKYNSAATKWSETPGCIVSLKMINNKWEKEIIDNFNNLTHTRMICVGDILGKGDNQLISNDVGVYNSNKNNISPKTSLNIYEKTDNHITKQVIDYPDLAIKSRGIAIGDIDNDGKNELIVGTRTLDIEGYKKTFLLCYKYELKDKTWKKDIIDTSGEIGFHTVAVVDIDDDGQDEIIASDDQKGQINMYKYTNGKWNKYIIKDYGHRIFVASINSLDI